MKKNLIVLVVFMFICLMPVTALADSTPPGPNEQYVLIKGYGGAAEVQLWGYDSAGDCQQIKDYDVVKTRVWDERILSFYNDKGTFISLQVIAVRNGETIKSNLVDIKEYGKYIYSVEDNVLEQGDITSTKLSIFSLIIYGFYLIFPLLFTILIEWIISWFFKLKPRMYVPIINLVTNPVLNILLLLLANSYIHYTLQLIVFETIIVGAEYWFYTCAYKGYSRKRLLLFSIVANAASWGLYRLLIVLL